MHKVKLCNFGEQQLNSNHPHGEWHLWIYCCAWRLEEGDQILTASEDSRYKIEGSPIEVVMTVSITYSV